MERSDRFPHIHAVRTHLRSVAKRQPNRSRVAIHEAGHCVAWWSLGIPILSATASRVARLRFGETHRDLSGWSYEANLIGTLAGRLADEVQGVEDPLDVVVGCDDFQAIGAAEALAEGDESRVNLALAWGVLTATDLLRDRWADVQRLAALIAARDVATADVEGVLGPLPSPAFPHTHTGEFLREGRIRALWVGVAEMLRRRTRSVAIVDPLMLPTPSGEAHIAWLAPDDALMVVSETTFRTGIGAPFVVGRPASRVA